MVARPGPFWWIASAQAYTFLGASGGTSPVLPLFLVAFFLSTWRSATVRCRQESLVAQCSATPATVAAVPPCSATPFQTQISGGFKRGGFPIWTCPSFFVLFCPFWYFRDFCGIFSICSGMVRGFSRLRGTVPKGSATQSGPFPKKVGNTRVWKPPGLASPKTL